MIDWRWFIDFVLHVDKYIGVLIQQYGILTYLILFLIIFIETGLVIMPFLPGDSLIFIVGTFAAAGYLNVFILFILLSAAAILGDTINYWIGFHFGKHVFEKSRLFKQSYYDKTQRFYEKYGGKTIIIARFVPIVRTFAPFVAGVAKMNYKRFLYYNVFGAIAWVALFLFAGYFFGSIQYVQDNLTIITYIIIVVSFIPPLVEFARHYFTEKKMAKKE